MDKNKTLIPIFVVWTVLLGLIIYLLIDECNNSSSDSSPTTTSVSQSQSAPAQTAESFTNFDYSVENYDNVSSVADNAALPEAEPVSQEFAEMVSTDDVVVPDVNGEEDEDMDAALRVEGTDLLIAAAADRFYSIDVRGQLNRNASNDLRGEPQIPFNSTYTPFHSSAIAGESAIPSGRLG